MAFGVLLGLYLIVRGIAEPFVIDMSDPAAYGTDWGGPSLAGVLAVHCGPGLVAAVLLGRALRRRRACHARSECRAHATEPSATSLASTPLSKQRTRT